MGRAWAAVVGIVLAGAPAFAQVAQLDTHSKAPIDITANQAEVVQSKCLAIWRGAAEALQDKARLRADTISIYSTPKAADANGQPACGNAERIVADGNVYYVTPDQNVRGDHAVYSAADDQIVLTGDVILVQGKDVARGDKLTLKVSTRQAILQPGAGGAAGGAKSGRVRAVYYPSTDQTPPSQKPPSPKLPSPNPGA